MKISKIIDKCNDCHNCFFSSSSKEQYHFAVCVVGEGILLQHGSEPAFRYKLAIPENCPLEDYTGTQTIEE